MIPAQNTVAWSKVAPWAEPRQVKQDLIIARALVQLFGDPLLQEELRFRGGTALNKLHFPKPLRYSEDIDLTRTKEGASKPIWDRVHDLSTHGWVIPSITAVRLRLLSGTKWGPRTAPRLSG